ncbi:MAG: methyltransferase domain-containing protein [Pirellulaceae bacterium]|nr:methyltransferase domain-containing protein [Pirellulaceae bacterium]
MDLDSKSELGPSGAAASTNSMDQIDHEIDRQTEYYDDHYSHVNVDAVVAKIRNLDEYFGDALLTDTSWHGLYQLGFADQLQGKRVLELGCGDGLNALIMTAKGAQVFAIDIANESKRIIDQAAAELGFGSDQIQPITGDFRKIDLDQFAPFDVVVGKAFLHHLTPEQEREYLAKAARLLTIDGQARFFEPAENSELIDKIRWMIPMGRRPSSLNREAFEKWSEHDPHPERSNSTKAYLDAARLYFHETTAIPIGSIERFHRLMPRGDFERKYRRWAHRMDRRMPSWIRSKFARSQTLIYRKPIQQ